MTDTAYTHDQLHKEIAKLLVGLLRTISDIKHLIARESDRSRLLEETCRIIVKNGGFRLAWVGEADFRTLEVHPVAQAGCEQRCPEYVDIRFDDSRQGRGPIGTAIKTGVYVVCEDIEKDETFIPWREAAREQGYRAMAAFPLKIQNRVIGTINVYAVNFGLFNEEMVRLLVELVDDLSYALQTLKERETRLQVESELLASEARYRDLYDHAPDMYLSIDADSGRVIDCNRTITQRTGFTKDEMIGRHVTELFHPDCLEQVKKNLRLFQETGEVRDSELRAKTKDGTWLDVSLNATAVRDEQGRVRFSRSIWRDITERKRVERALKAREGKLRSIFRVAPIGIGLVSYPDRTLLEVNDLLCQMIGYSPGELVGRCARMIYPSDEDFNQVRRDKYAQIETRGTGTVETRWQRKDGTIIDVLLSSTPLDEEDYSLGITFTALDISEQKYSEAALRASEEKYRTHFENVYDVIYSFDRRLRIIDVSPSVEQLSGYSPEELVGKPITELPILSPAFWKQALADIQQVLAGNRVESREYEFTSKDGSIKWGEVSGAPLIVQGEVAGVVFVARDITERRRDKEALQALAQQWQTTFDAMRDMVCLLDDQSRVVQYNRAFREFLDKSPEEILGQPCWKLMHGTDVPPEKCPAVRMRQTRRRETMDLEINGKWFDISADPIFNNDGQLTGAVHILSEITEIKKNEQALRESEERFRNIFENAAEGIFQSTPEGKFIRVNPAHARMFGFRVPRGNHFFRQPHRPGTVRRPPGAGGHENAPG